MTLLSDMTGLEAFNARMLRINYARVEGAMDILAPEVGEAERIYTTRTTLPLIGCDVAIQYSRRSTEVDCGQKAKLTVSLGGGLIRLAIDDIRREAGQQLLTCDSLRVIGREALQPTQGGSLDGFAVTITQDGEHKLFGLANGLDIELRGADIGHADDLAVACITILERRSDT